MEVFCEEVLLAAWVFKPSLTKRSSVAPNIFLYYKTKLCQWVRYELHSGGSESVIYNILSCTRLEGNLCVCVCVGPVSCRQQQQQLKFPHIWWQRWDSESSSKLEEETHRKQIRRRRVESDISRLQTILC